jgi:hypothetical protein
MIFVEEKGIYKIDCSRALWATDQIHGEYHASGVPLSDVDFIAETQEHIYFIEYKNGMVDAAIAHGANFNPSEPKTRDTVVKKFYDSVHYLTVKAKQKPIKYVYIVEYPNADVTARKMLRNAIAKNLPFKLQTEQSGEAINHFEVVSIDEWNKHDEYSQFPLMKA